MNSRELIERLETYVTDLVMERRHHPLDQFMRGLLFCLSRTFRTVVQWRIQLYRHRILRPKTPGCLVLSIGNLTVGGTGKTPVVEVLARVLAEKGRKVAILSRGYRSRADPFWRTLLDMALHRSAEPPPRVVTEGNGALLDSDRAGDEPYMLALNLPNVIILVDKDRVKSGRFAIRHYGVDTLILDDGFQYLPLKPRLNILLIDASMPFGNHHLLPRGMLREPIENLRRADFIFLTKSGGGKHLRHLKTFIHKHNAEAEIIECTHRPLYLENVLTGERSPLELLAGKKVASLCGIAMPDSFERALRRYGAELVHFARFADHHRFTRREVALFCTHAVAAQAQLILTTQKDAVRFPPFELWPTPVLFMRVEIGILHGQESFDQCIARICFAKLGG